jgi:hypothetical protein
MASRRKKVAKAVPFSASDLQNIQKANPYVQRLIEDAELRDNLTTAIDSGRSAYNRLLSSKSPHKAALDDKKLHKDVSSAAEAARDAVIALGDAPKYSKPKKKKRGGFGRKLLLLLIGGGVALAASEGLRSKVLDLLFGAEEEFEYTPPAPATQTPPASPVTAA